jgi:hypothetical protein
LVELQEGGWPLVIVRIPPVLDEVAIKSMFAGFDRMTARRRKFSALIDTSAMTGVPDALGRKLIAEERISRSMTEAAFNLGNAVLMVSAPARVVLRLIEWMRPPVVPQRLVATEAEGIEWCCGQLIKAGIPLPPQTEALRAPESERRSMPPRSRAPSPPR